MVALPTGERTQVCETAATTCTPEDPRENGTACQVDVEAWLTGDTEAFAVP